MSSTYKLIGDGTAIVTGASAGIGVVLARALAKKGYDLVLVARREDRLRELADELHMSLGTKVTVLAQDLSKSGAAKKVHAFTKGEGLDVALLVNNAGFGWDGEVVDMPEKTAHDMMMLNMVTLTELSALYAKDLVARGSGGIINVSSVAGVFPMPRFAVYAATKSYVTSFSLALAAELEDKGVRVQAVCPGGTDTEFGQVAGRDADQPGGPLRMTAEEVGALALKGFDKGDWMTTTGLVNQAASNLGKFIPLEPLLKFVGWTRKKLVQADG